MTHSRHFPGARELVSCPICRSDDVGPYIECRDRHYGIRGTFGTRQCNACGLVYLDPMLSTSELAGLYPENYYSYQPPQMPSGMKRVVKRMLWLERKTLMPEFTKPGALLDVGCGAGQYLLEMQSRGWRVHGSELSKEAADAGKSVGLDIRGGELMDAGFADQEFDLVRSNHSLEHMADPRHVLREMHRVLKSDGTLVIGVPNIDGLLARLFGRYWWNFGVPVHTYNFNTKNIRLLLSQCGFTVVRIRYYSDYSSLLGSIQILVNRKKFVGLATGRILGSWILRLPAQILVRLLDLLRMGDCIEVECRRE